MLRQERAWAKASLWIVIVGALFFFGMRAYYRITDDFQISNMTYDLPFNFEWEAATLALDAKEEIWQAFNLPYHYIGKGAQSYAFLSEDGNHVIKFFKFKHLKPNWLTEALPNFSVFDSYKIKSISRKDRLIKSVFKGYKLAYDLHKEESGLLYIHLNKTTDIKKQLTLIDKIGRPHVIDLDSTIFILQERARTTRDILQEALEKKDLVSAEKRIDQILNLYLSEYQKGIYDRDHGWMHNTGFVGEKAIHLDTGKLTEDGEMRSSERYLADLQILGIRFAEWLKDNFPQYRRSLLSHFENKVLEKTGEKINLLSSDETYSQRR